jgi:catechol 2,3-dioxygenase-like lactoylglutathione lyase family enzyme
MAKPVHSMIRVLDEAKSLDFYARAFGLEVADHLKFPDFALIYLRHPSSPFEVELTVNFDRKQPYTPGRRLRPSRCRCRRCRCRARPLRAREAVARPAAGFQA